MLVGKSLVLWLLLCALAIVNGGLRERCLAPAIGERAALPLSGITLSLVILLATALTLPWLGPLTASGALAVGVGWLALTLVFEFALGWRMGKTRRQMLAAYDPRGGNLWLLVLAVTLLAPWLCRGLTL